MNAQWKQKWIQALRSDKYSQGTWALRDKSNRFCCLGVLCDIVNPKLWSKNTTIRGAWQKDAYTYDGKDWGVIPNSVLDIVNIDSVNDLLCPNGRFTDKKTQCEYSLSGQNDSGSSFEEIANIIEKYF